MIFWSIHLGIAQLLFGKQWLDDDDGDGDDDGDDGDDDAQCVNGFS